GGLINLSCKLIRSPNIYNEQIEDECADLFIYLLLFGRMLGIHNNKDVLKLIDKNWNMSVDGVVREEDYYSKCVMMIEKTLCFLKPEKEHFYNEEYFYEIFLSIQQVSSFITKLDWQNVVNRFHYHAINKYTDINLFTPDGLYKGSFRINIDRLLCFTWKIGLE